jgi:hypothetical protein
VNGPYSVNKSEWAPRQLCCELNPWMESMLVE